MTAATCSKCPALATHQADAGWRKVGDVWVAQERPLCDACGWDDALEQAEKRSA